MVETNKHGLGRPIPPEIKGKIRKECGFGCVKCGYWLCEYDHFAPEFKDAMSHDPNHVTCT
jgi:hypothetical protein